MNKWQGLSKSIVFLLVFSVLVGFCWANLVPRWVGALAGIFLFFIVSSWWRYVFDNVFNIPEHSLRAFVVSFFTTFISVTSLAGLGVSVGRLDAFVGGASFFCAGLIALLFKKNTVERESHTAETEIKEEMALDKILVLIYLILFFVGINILYHARVGVALTTPWQVIPAKFILVYFFAAILLIRLLFSDLPTKAVLFLISLQTFLTVSYLPFTHQLFYGADIWRHLAVENAFINTGTWQEVIANGARPIFDWGKLSYAQFLSSGIIFHKVFSLNLIWLNKWLQPILWSLFFPLLAFSFTQELGHSKKVGLWAGFLGIIFFALQFAGAFTLPVNLGFLCWLFLLWLLMKYYQERRLGQMIFLLIFGGLLIFNYSLYFILFWMIWGILEILYRTRAVLRFKKTLIKIGLFLLTAISIPAIEIVAGFSALPSSWNWLGAIKQFAGNLIGWFLAFGPRTHDIAAGNILFNQVPQYAFVANFLTVDRYWLIAVAGIFWLAGFFGICWHWRKNNFRLNSLAVLSGLWVGYFFSRYLLAGENILARRLDIVLAFLTVIFAAQFLVNVCTTRLAFVTRSRKLCLVISSIFLAGVLTASFSFGPDTNSVSVDQYQAAKYIVSQIGDSEKACVLGDTYPLLAVEAVSAKKIVGGGFPISANFAQPERVQLVNDLRNAQNVEAILLQAKEITGAKRCWLITDDAAVKYDKENLIKVFNNTKILRF